MDSTPLYDAVATMDTVTLMCSAIRGLLKAAGADLQTELRGLLARDDDYTAAGKPVCDYEDRTAREALVDALAHDAMALVGALDGRELGPELDKAAQLLATVVGQDLDHDTDGVFRIARRVAKDRVISTVDPQARHGHKTSARGFDGYKGHLAADPDSEIITATTVTAANRGDADAAEDLLAEDLPEPVPDGSDDTDGDGRGDSGGGQCDGVAGVVNEPDHAAADADTESVAAQQLAVYGDAAYGAGPLLARLENAGARIITKVQPPPALGGRFAKDRFTIDLAAHTVTCPGQVVWRSGRSKTVAVSPRSEPPALAAPWPRSAPPRPPGAPSRSAPTSPNSPVPAPPRPTPPGRPTTPPPDPRSNARSGT
jgi:hypothetical protein